MSLTRPQKKKSNNAIRTPSKSHKVMLGRIKQSKQMQHRNTFIMNQLRANSSPDETVDPASYLNRYFRCWALAVP